MTPKILFSLFVLGLTPVGGLVAFLWPPASISAAALIQGVFIFPVLEEFVFRGILLREFERMTTRCVAKHLTLANLLSTMIFVLVHWLNRDMTVAFLVLVPSLLLGKLYELSRSVSLCICIHGIWNAFYFGVAVAASLLVSS